MSYSRLLSKSFMIFLENEDMQIHKITDTHIWLIIPEEYEKQERLKIMIRDILRLGLKITRR